MQEWYRTSDWDEAAQEDFEKRLRRARSSRPQYLRIKALALQEAGLPHEAETLIRRLLAEHPDDDFERPFALELLGDLVREQGRLGEAEANYREALEDEHQPGGRTGLVPVSLTEVLTDTGRREEAWALLHSADAQNEVLETFHHSRFVGSRRVQAPQMRCKTRALLHEQRARRWRSSAHPTSTPGIQAWVP